MKCTQAIYCMQSCFALFLMYLLNDILLNFTIRSQKITNFFTYLLIILVWSYVCLIYSREPFIILSGGLSYDTVGRRPCLTVMHGKSTAVLEMDYSIVDFLTLCETPYPNGRLCKDFSLYFDLISLEFYPIRIFLTIVLVLSLGIRLQQ